MKKWLNYHHLYYFRAIASEGGIAKAAEKLRLGQPTLSTQLKQLEDSLGHELFERRNRSLHLTEAGTVVLNYANEIFRMGDELLQVLEDRSFTSRVHVQIGIIDSVPKTLTRLVVEAALREQNCSVSILEGKSDELFRDLSAHKLDLVVADFAPASTSDQRVYARSLVRLPISVFGNPEKHKHLKKDFPNSLNGQNMVMPTVHTKLRHDLDHYFNGLGVTPRVVAECQDTSVQKLLGVDGVGLIPIPEFAAQELVDEKKLIHLGLIRDVKAEFWLVSAARRIENPIAAKLYKSFDLGIG